MSLFVKTANIFRSSKRVLIYNLPNLKIALNSQIKNYSNNVTIYFIDRDGSKKEVKANTGTNLLDVMNENKFNMEGFDACEGTLSCSTCHLILEKENYAKLKPPSDEENDMLDLAFGLKETSRLGCQVIVNEQMQGWTFIVPKEVADARN